ncbi:hypothetical protein J4E83_009851 [Alternaria metachromatica]|uniref:uncharacterized protein n=1 Tax=Alternaria metachromatica TaxID=283354 RepID=UPI0020C51AC6|nr:uncharacterized protein J4E83_009851 [Alternaria metachromatica]KAI4606940.1 hypothetical protein J4E83_009851 [Alternaria metachromatica]
MLILISGCGHFHRKETAIKEVAGGLILTHVSLAIAIIVQMYKKTLTSVDAAIGAAVLDAQNVALHIPVAAKQTLAARWQVLILIPAQILGLAFLPVLVIKFIEGSFTSEDCNCFGFFWWSHFSDCEVFPSSELSLFWIYYSLRWIMWAQASVHSIYNAEWFHRSEKEGRIPVSFSENGSEDDSKEARVLERQQFPERRLEKATIQTGLLYKEYSATTSVSHTTYALYSITSMAVAEVTIRKYSLQPVSQVNSIGQIIAMVVALATFIRVVWSFQNLYNRFENNSFPDLVFNPRTSWPAWCCCVDSKEDGTGGGQASTSPKQDGEDSRKESETDSEHRGSGGRRSPQYAAPISPSKREAGGQPDQYLQQYPQPPASRNGRPLLDDTDRPKTQPYSFLEKDSGTQYNLPGQPNTLPQRSHPYEPGYRFEFRQPFHLDAVKQLFLPTFTQYLEARKEEKVAVPTNDVPTTPPFEPTAYTLPVQSQTSVSKGKAPLSLSVEEAPHQAEVSTSASSEHPGITSGKPSNSISGNMKLGTDNSNVTIWPQKDHALKELQPQSATRRDMTPASISTRSGPQEHEPTAAKEPEEQQPASLSFPIQTPEEELPEFSKAGAAAKSLEPVISYQGFDERQGVQYGVPQDNGSAHTEEKSPLPLSISCPWRDSADPIPSTSNLTDIGLGSKIENPGIADQSETGEGPQEPEARSETGRASIRSVDPIDTEDQKTEDHSTTALDSGGLELESAHLSLIGREEDLQEQSRRDPSARPWGLVTSDLRGVSSREVSPDDLHRDPPGLRLKRTRKQQSDTVWKDYSSFLRHCLTFEGHGEHSETKMCHQCAKSSTFSNPAPQFFRLTELARHIWDEHLHKVECDPSSPSLPQAEQGKGKSAEASGLGRSECIDDGRVHQGTVIDLSIFEPHPSGFNSLALH